VASSEALNLLHWALHALLYRPTTTAIKMASKVISFCHYCFVCCCPGNRRGNMEQGVFAQWQHLVASGVALDMLHQAMHTA
jgi:hypothetical protein